MSGTALSASAEFDGHEPLLTRFASMDRCDPRRPATRDELFALFAPVPRRIAGRFARRGEPIEDLEQVANIGLLHALERFDPTRGGTFLSFAVPTITGELRRHFRDATWSVRTPRAVKERYLQVNVASAALAQTLARDPAPEEVAKHLDCSRDEVLEAIGAGSAHHPNSLDACRAGREDEPLERLGVDDVDLDYVEARDVVRRLVAALPERERRILVSRFVHEMTQTEIGVEIGVSQMHVSRLLRGVFGLLRTEALQQSHFARATTPAPAR